MSEDMNRRIREQLNRRRNAGAAWLFGIVNPETDDTKDDEPDDAA